MKTATYVSFFGVLGLLLTGIQSGPESGHVNGSAAHCAQVGELIAFVVKETGYPPVQNCPRVRVTSTEALIAIIAPHASAQGEVPRAAYVAANREILLSPDVVLATPIGLSYLVHEFVHMHQFESGAYARAPCVGWLEGEAYRVQASYLRTHGLAKDAFAFEMLGMLQSACAHFYHK